MSKYLFQAKISVDHVIFFCCHTLFSYMLPYWLRMKIWRRFYCHSSLLVSNLIGPEDRMSLAGSPVKDVSYWLPPLDNIALCVSFLTYAGQLYMTVNTDVGVIPDPDVITRLFIDKVTIYLLFNFKYDS